MSDAFGNALGNSIVKGLSSKSNSQSENEANQRGKQAYEQAIDANIPHEQAKLLALEEVMSSLSPDKRQKVSIVQDGDTLQIANNRLDRSKGGITMSGTNAVDSIMGLTSWISDEGLWGNNDVLKLAMGQLSNRAAATQYSVAKSQHEMKYYALGGHNGVFDQYGTTQTLSMIPKMNGHSSKTSTIQQSSFGKAWNQYVAYSSQDVTPVPAAQSVVSNALFVKSLHDTAQKGIMAHTKPGATMFALGNNLVTLDGTQRPGFNPDQLPINSRTVTQGLSATGVMVNALKSGAGVGAFLAPVGTAIEYSIQGKPILSEAFAKDSGVDMIKGGVSGAVGGAVTTAVIAGAAIFAGTVAAPVVAGAVIIGFAASWAFGEHVFDPVVGDDLKKWWKN